MGKNSIFFGQPIYGQLIKSLDRDKIVGISRKHGGERYVKSFDGFTHLVTMLYTVIMRFDSLREIETSMAVEVRKLYHVGIETVPKRSTLSDANARRSEKFFEEVSVICTRPTRVKHQYGEVIQQSVQRLGKNARRILGIAT